LVTSGQADEQTFYLEVLRADIKGGNARLRAKMDRYIQLAHVGAFNEIFNHQRLRAVLFLTTSPTRAEHLRQYAQGLRHGRRLFWFGSSESRSEHGECVSTLTPELLLTPRWLTADGELLSIIPPGKATSAG
jgi:hypothetical protein